MHERPGTGVPGDESLATGEFLSTELTTGFTVDAEPDGAGTAPVERDEAAAARADRRTGLIVLAVMLGAVTIASFFNPRVWPATLLFIGLIVPMVLFHEWGHYWTAKRFGIASREFFVGFGPRLWSFQRGDTEFGIKAFFPLGGYVKIVGMSQYEDVDPRFEGRTFKDAKRWQRAIVLVAGSVTHFTTALVLLFVILVFIGVATPTTTVDRVEADSPAVAAGIEPGDRIVSVAGVEVDAWEDVSGELRRHPGETIQVVVERNSETMTLDTTLEEREEGGETIGFLGVGPREVAEKTSVIRAVPETFEWFGGIRWGNLVAVRDTFAASNVAKIVDQIGGGESRTDYRMSSPVGIANVAQQVVARGLLPFLYLVIVINVFVGMFNLFPLLPLDGGHLAVLGTEAVVSKVRRRPFEFDQRHLMPITIAVLMFLMVIFVSSLYLDISDPPRL
ncbi:MAG: site-2 protease family protein [Acidimicrobiia bacterium]|nr:site-2 protease family protein [Acidimicrobiia bacterium]